ncbi:MAG: hypothetical protein Q8O60_01685, partial [Deltaproteobacteria bacterium]|nr:hypothetical protein [Deltaproteobacteria bacterium]
HPQTQKPLFLVERGPLSTHPITLIYLQIYAKGFLPSIGKWLLFAGEITKGGINKEGFNSKLSAMSHQT